MAQSAVVRRAGIVMILMLSTLSFGTVFGLSAVGFTIQTVDGLGRPVPRVEIEISCDSASRRFTRINLVSDKDGYAHGEYDSASCTPLDVSVKKQGYESYSTGFSARYILRRTHRAQELSRVLNADPDTQRQELRELLAGDFGEEWYQFRDSVFYSEAQLRPILRTLALEPDLTERARDLLSMIAVPEDLHFIMQLPPPSLTEGFPERWRYSVVTALVDPDSEDEWTFLRRCVLNDFDDGWLDAGAIQTLMLTASTRSRELLKEARKQNPKSAASIEWALAYIKSSPAPLAGSNLNALARRVAEVTKLGDWLGNSKPRFNEAGDKALVDFSFHSGFDGLRYTATFHRVNGLWRLRGAHETYRAFVPPAPTSRKQKQATRTRLNP
jgi:hypothetical protein